MPGVLIVEALAQTGAIAVLVAEENRGKLALFAGIDDVRFKRIVSPGDDAHARLRDRGRARPDRARQGDGAGRDELAARGTLTFAVAATDDRARPTGRAVSITGLGVHVPERVVTNDDLAQLRRHHRRVDRRAARGSASGAWRPTTRRSPTSPCPPRGPRSRTRASTAADIDLLIVRTVTPDMMFPSTAALMADPLGRERRRRVRPARRLHRLHVRGSRRPTGCSRPGSSSGRS